MILNVSAFSKVLLQLQCSNFTVVSLVSSVFSSFTNFSKLESRGSRLLKQCSVIRCEGQYANDNLIF